MNEGWGWEVSDLLEILMLGNHSSPSNKIYQVSTVQPQTVRAWADLPSFLLAPITKDFPHVYCVQVTRNLEDHVNSTRYMFQMWAQDRRKHPLQPVGEVS